MSHKAVKQEKTVEYDDKYKMCSIILILFIFVCTLEHFSFSSITCMSGGKIPHSPSLDSVIAIVQEVLHLANIFSEIFYLILTVINIDKF